MDKIKVGIIGTGFGVKVQAVAMQAHPRFEVVGLAGRNPETTKDKASEHGIPFVTTNWKDLLKEELDLVSVATPPYLHYEMARKVLKKNKILLLEKPTTSNAYEAKKLFRYADEHNIVAMMSHEFRHVPVRAYLHDLIQNGRIGKVREFHLSQYFGFGARKSVNQFGWFWQNQYDGGLIGALGSHLIDWTRFTLNDEFHSVQGSIYTRIKERADKDGKKHLVTADDGFSFLFDTEKGVTGDIVFSSTVFNQSSKLIVGGEKGTIVVDGSEIAISDGSSIEQLSIPDTYNLDNSLLEKDGRIPPYMKLLDDLVTSIDTETSLSPNLYDGWMNQLVLDSVKLSHNSGSRIFPVK